MIHETNIKTRQTNENESSVAIRSGWLGRLAYALHEGLAGRNVSMAFVYGFLLGPLGIALVLKSWLDGFLSLAMCILLVLIGPELPPLFLWALYGVWIVVRLKHRGSRTPTAAVTATV